MFPCGDPYQSWMPTLLIFHVSQVIHAIYFTCKILWYLSHGHISFLFHRGPHVATELPLIEVLIIFTIVSLSLGLDDLKSMPITIFME